MVPVHLDERHDDQKAAELGDPLCSFWPTLEVCEDSRMFQNILIAPEKSGAKT